jgi:surface protein
MNSNLDDVPSDWGGYGFNAQTTGIYVLEIPSDNYMVEITNNDKLIFEGGYVNWGDGTPVTQIGNSIYHHSYAKAGRYEVKAKCVPGGYTIAAPCKDVIVEVKQLPEMANNFNCCFSGAKNLEKVTAYNLAFGDNGIKSMFYNCSKLKEVVGIETWNVQRVSDMGSLFGNCTSLEYLKVGDWNTSNCSSFFNLFYNCKRLEDLDVSKWDTTSAVTFETMFSGCESLESLDLANWTTPKIEIMRSMFSGCLSLKEIKNMDNITTNKVKLMNSMFSKCRYLTDLDLDTFDACSVVNMDYIFQDCYSLVNLKAMKNIKENISVDNSVDLTVDSMMSIINNLVDISEIEEWMATLPSKDQESLPLSRVFKVGPNNLAKLSAAQIKVATDKGWSVA